MTSGAEWPVAQVTFADPDELSRRIIAERPVCVCNTIAQRLGVFPDFHVEDHTSRVATSDGRGHFGGRRHASHFLALHGVERPRIRYR